MKYLLATIGLYTAGVAMVWHQYGMQASLDNKWLVMLCAAVPVAAFKFLWGYLNKHNIKPY